MGLSLLLILFSFRIVSGSLKDHVVHGVISWIKTMKIHMNRNIIKVD